MIDVPCRGVKANQSLARPGNPSHEADRVVVGAAAGVVRLAVLDQDDFIAMIDGRSRCRRGYEAWPSNPGVR